MIDDHFASAINGNPDSRKLTAMGTTGSRPSGASNQKQHIKVEIVRRILRFAVPYRWPLALFLLLVLLDAAIGVATPLVYRNIINNGILKEDAALIIYLSVVVALLGLFAGALGLAQSYVSSKIGSRIVLSLRMQLFEHIQQMSLAFFTHTQTGALVSRLNSDVTGAQNAFTDILSNVVGNLVTIVLVLAAMFVLSWQITLAALILFPIFILPAHFWGRKLQEITRESFDLNAAMDSLMVERFNVAGAQLVRIFGHQRNESEQFTNKAERVSDIGVKRTFYSRLFFTALMLTAVFATAIAYGWGGILAVKRMLDVGTVVALASYLARLYGPLALIGLSNIQLSFMTAYVSFDRVFEVLDLVPLIKEKPNAIAIPSGPAQISFDHVSFRYPTASLVSLASLETVASLDTTPEKNVLKDVTFVAEPGHLVALVGPSGAGKTTITHLIARFYDVQSGSVKINGIDVRDAKLTSLHQRIGIVTQDPHLFHETIRANLLYAKPNATTAELVETLRSVQMFPLIASLPMGLDTIVGDRGYRFSGGEKQRLAIARLLLKAPDIVILDEATAHLDSESEADIQCALEILLRGRTSIVIAHRLSTVVKADQIIVMQEGRIVERGTHPELLNLCGLYSELHRRQSAAQIT
jgi:ATP-binding cassette, subfamily B, bacterial